MDQEKFLQTFKSLGFPRVGKFSASNFDSAFSNTELKQFLNCFCELNEENVLTDEELKEYASITPNELISLENLIEAEKISPSVSFNESQEEEEEYLKECLTRTEKHYEVLLEQKKLFLEHQTMLTDEKAECEKAHFNLKKMNEKYMMNKIPQVQEKLISTLNSIFELISKTQNEIKTMQNNDYILPKLKLKDIQDYFAEEEKVIALVPSFIKNNYQFTDKEQSILSSSNLSKEEIIKETHILKKLFRKSKILEIQAVSDYKKRNTAVKFFKDYKNGILAQSFNVSNTLLSVQLNEELTNNENLKKKEAMLMSYLSNAIDELLEAKCREIAIAKSNEVLQDYEKALETISFPLSQIINQAARLRLFLLHINLHHQYLLDIKVLIDKVSEFLNSENQFCTKRKKQYEEFNEIIEDNTYLEEDSLFLSAYKILNHDTQHLNKATMNDVLVEIGQLNKSMATLKEQHEHNNNVIEILENRYSNTEKLLNGNDFFKLMTLENSFSTQINRLTVLLAEICKNYEEIESCWNHKNKLLQTKRNLKLSRSLYILALLEKNMFYSICETIKKKKYAQDSGKEN